MAEFRKLKGIFHPYIEKIIESNILAVKDKECLLKPRISAINKSGYVIDDVFYPSEEGLWNISITYNSYFNFMNVGKPIHEEKYICYEGPATLVAYSIGENGNLKKEKL